MEVDDPSGIFEAYPVLLGEVVDVIRIGNLLACLLLDLLTSLHRIS